MFKTTIANFSLLFRAPPPAEAEVEALFIALNALAITVGVAVIAGIPWQVMDKSHLIPLHADVANLAVLLSVTYVVSVVYGN